MNQKSENLLLPCTLTEEELLQYGLMLAAERPKEELLDNELKEFADQVKANKAKIKTKIVDLSNRINQKKEMRMVECVVRYLYDRNEKIWIRTDTNEVVKREPIPAEELQTEIELETPEQERE